MTASSDVIGTVRALTRYPVKSMQGERLTEAELQWTGFHGDRQWAFLRTGNRSGFPWLTGREAPSLVRCEPRAGERSVVLPSGAVVGLDAPDLQQSLAAEAGEAVHVMQLSRGAFDAMPVSLASTATLRTLDTVHGTPLDPRRFRFNLVLDSPHHDRDWRGRQLVFPSGAALLVSDGIPRCAMITLDPDTAKRDVGVLRTVAQSFGNRLGVYAATASPGMIRIGDPVRLA